MSDEKEKIEQKDDQLIIPDTLPLLPIRDVVIFPFMIVPLFVGREKSINAVDMALTKERLVFLATQRDISDEEPQPKDLYQTGTIGMIMRMLKLPDGRVKILVQGITRAVIKQYTQEHPTYVVAIDKIKENPVTQPSLEVEAMMRNVREQLERLASLGKVISPEIMMIIESMNEPGRLADIVAANLGLKVDDAQSILEVMDPVKRLEKVNEYLVKELQVSTMQAKIQSQAKEEMDKSQREYFLREQMRAIKSELGELEEITEEVDEIRKKVKKAKMPSDVEKEALKQADRLESMHPDAAESAIIRTYLDWLVDLPWSKSTKDTLDIKKAKKVLDEDHYNLEKIKERILEYLAVRKLHQKSKGPILCFVGPPGVGKTSLGRSIARAMGRKFVRISLGGIKDEAEIRGHRRTYVGALPGRIIQGIKQAGTNNPVFMMDEVDKIGTDFRGDPSSALLEVLDPEQNNAFSDHYLNLPFDLSKVMFITTANMLDPIPDALKDRMEVLELTGYTEEEKLEIVKKYIIERQLTENGLNKKLIEITDDAIKKIISQYTKEAGLRNLEREIASVCRKVARKVAEGEKGLSVVTTKAIEEYLGVPKFIPEAEQEEDEVGVATGLAWTPVGGEILYIEATTMKGKGNLTLTGHLGEVMKESAHAALSYARSRAKMLGLAEDFYKELDIHVHVPAGAIPKDGPSAGVTMATALISTLTKTPVSKDIAMTGEITLRGRVLPIGGVKEKALAALRAKINTIILPERNKKDIEEIPKDIQKKLKFVFVRHMDDVLKVALKKKVKAVKKPLRPLGKRIAAAAR
ncbi:MAG: endopeptidase La [Deltaproteobacteria bacterium RIFCSPLOWO2_12_FULL_43_16]|nr:MAG: endopeptidase La [Deltaproteobacteria bacterium GWA2_43_19]OGQ10097.1 MAG: endopeptidase La [Deltaproteobacteria bacterium RIFCSPHIGHO2_02_FULL_43_33]OGQ58730.1 MAG: endopeptidase La [Deltaproteobacteria bacterium RIFCSPLOWO2_12_FULL_43_16]